jgi:hypothetical protein
MTKNMDLSWHALGRCKDLLKLAPYQHLNNMKKLIGLFAFLLVLAASQAQAQAPSCSNDNGLNARIAAIEQQGFTEINRQWFQVLYLVAPTPPYLNGTLEITFVGPYCGPACTPAIRVERFDNFITNNQGNCVWRPGGDN